MNGDEDEDEDEQPYQAPRRIIPPQLPSQPPRPQNKSSPFPSSKTHLTAYMKNKLIHTSTRAPFFNILVSNKIANDEIDTYTRGGVSVNVAGTRSKNGKGCS